MKALLKKEFSLCAHPTCFVFLAFACFVFIPNYPYEVMFFFSGLSVFFVCLTARENGDCAFTVALPVKKGDAAIARILACACFQLALLVCAGITVTVKEICFPPEMRVNMGGMAANCALIGSGAVILGVFNAVFFPVYFHNPAKVGKPFVLAGAAVFALIILLIVMRFSVPFFRDVLNAPDPVSLGVKVCYAAAGLVCYALLSFCSARISAKRFEKTDL